MIGLVDLEPSAACAWAISLKSLPEPPALKCSAFVIRCDYQVPMDAVIPWFERVRSRRPHVPIGAVVRAAVPSLISAMRHGIQFMPLIEEHELDQGLLPLHFLETVREHAVDGRLLVVWRTRWNLQGPEAESLAAAAAAVGVTGGGLTTLCRRLQCSQATLYRRFRQIGLPAPGKALGHRPSHGGPDQDRSRYERGRGARRCRLVQFHGVPEGAIPLGGERNWEIS